MKSVWSRNVALLLIATLVIHVLNGIHSQQKHRMIGDNSHCSPRVEEQNIVITADIINQVLRSGHLPAKDGKEGRRLTMEELEEVASSGKIPAR